MLIRLTTFNVENLFNRYLLLDSPQAPYEKAILPAGIAGIDRFGGPQAETTTLLQRDNTARAILECRPDILAVQEVEDLRALRSFNAEYLDGWFDRLIMLAGNDGRGINVGVCVRRGCPARVTGLRTHADELTPEAETAGLRLERFFNSDTHVLEARNALFSRDCLEVDIDVGQTRLTLLVNHFKSQAGSRGASDAIRRTQAQRVAELVQTVRAGGRHPIVIGDLNQHWDTAGSALQSLRDLVAAGVLVDPFAGATDAWTHYYSIARETSRLDYILVAAELEPALRETTIVRRGLTMKCCQFVGERYPTVGHHSTEASDHCPVTVALDLDDHQPSRRSGGQDLP